MPAEILHCPACGASASSDATRCQFCGATLATIACPSCFGMMFVGAKFCSHCGAKANRLESASKEDRLCPRCKAQMKMVTVGSTTFLECAQCEGIWLSVEDLQQICTDREKQSAVLGMPAPPNGVVEIEQAVRYVPCPVCHQLMNRLNFARCSGVIVDICKAHGTWFDKDELRRTVEFVRAGGMEKARAQQLQQIKDEQRNLAAARMSSAPIETSGLHGFTRDDPNDLASGAIDLLFHLLR